MTYKGIRQILDEMVYNICENGIKYNKEGGTLSVWVGSTLKGKQDYRDRHRHWDSSGSAGENL